MLGKIPPWILGPVGLLAILGLSFAGWNFLLKPKEAEIATVEENIATEQAKARQRPQAEEALDKVKREWVLAHEGLAQKMDERSIPLSMGHPFVAMTNLWRETREDLPQLVEKFIRESGCVLIGDQPGWGPPMAPPDPSTSWIRFAVGPSGATAGTAMPGGGGGPMWVAGSIADIERLYKSLRNFPRVATIHHLGLVRLRDLMGTQMYDTVRRLVDRPEDEIMVAPIILTVYLMTESAEGAGAAAPGAAGGGPGAPGAAGAPGAPAAPKGPAPGGPPSPPEKSGDAGDGE